MVLLSGVDNKHLRTISKKYIEEANLHVRVDPGSRN